MIDNFDENGRSGGGYILVTTRSGTNEFHGAVYEYLRNEVFDARTFFARDKAPLRYNIFGASVGRPIIKDRTFFFFNYEGARRRDGVTRSGIDVPHPPEINGDFSARKDVVILDPLTGEPFPNNIIPVERMDPIGRAIAQLYPAFLFRDGMPAVTREELGPEFGAVPIGSRPRSDVDFMRKNHVNGYAQQRNLTLQKSMGEDYLFEVAYLANVAHKLGGANVNINMIPLVDGQGPARQDQKLKPFPQFNGVFLESPPWGNSSHHSMNIKIEKRYSSGLNFLTNYTWSKFLDDVESPNELGGESGNRYTHIALRHLDKALGGNDVRHRLVASGVYELPFGTGRPWLIQNPVLNAIAGNWGLDLIAEFRAGPPFGIVEQTNRSNTFSHVQRPNLLGNPTLPSDRLRSEQVEEWFDTSAFESPGAGIFGNAPRNICCGPGFIGIDMSVHKWWNFDEDRRLQFRTDFYNLPNRPNFDLPSLSHGRGDFGKITNVKGTGRQIQFALRFEF